MHKYKQIGTAAEELALAYLLRQGLTLVARNFNSRFGEIDLIMCANGEYVFVEVKLRRRGINHAIESINYSKQQKLVKAAQYFLVQLAKEVNCRFDAIVLDTEGNIEWLKNIIIL